MLVFDGDCGFCTSAARLSARLVKDTQIVPWQAADLHSLGIRATDAAEAVQWVDSDRRVSAGAVAFARMLRTGPLLLWLVGSLLLLPGIRQLAALVYHLIAKNRHRLPGGTPACKVG